MGNSSSKSRSKRDNKTKPTTTTTAPATTNTMSSSSNAQVPKPSEVPGGKPQPEQTEKSSSKTANYFELIEVGPFFSLQPSVTSHLLTCHRTEGRTMA